MIQMKKAILNVAKTAKTYDEFIDRIYALGEWIWISDINDNIVEYIGNNNHMYSVDCSKYTTNLD